MQCVLLSFTTQVKGTRKHERYILLIEKEIPLMYSNIERAHRKQHEEERRLQKRREEENKRLEAVQKHLEGLKKHGAS